MNILLPKAVRLLSVVFDMALTDQVRAALRARRIVSTPQELAVATTVESLLFLSVSSFQRGPAGKQLAIFWMGRGRGEMLVARVVRKIKHRGKQNIFICQVVNVFLRDILAAFETYLRHVSSAAAFFGIGFDMIDFLHSIQFRDERAPTRLDTRGAFVQTERPNRTR